MCQYSAQKKACPNRCLIPVTPIYIYILKINTHVLANHIYTHVQNNNNNNNIFSNYLLHESTFQCHSNPFNSLLQLTRIIHTCCPLFHLIVTS